MSFQVHLDVKQLPRGSENWRLLLCLFSGNWLFSSFNSEVNHTAPVSSKTTPIKRLTLHPLLRIFSFIINNNPKTFPELYFACNHPIDILDLNWKINTSTLFIHPWLDNAKGFYSGLWKGWDEFSKVILWVWMNGCWKEW